MDEMATVDVIRFQAYDSVISELQFSPTWLLKMIDRMATIDELNKDNLLLREKLAAAKKKVLFYRLLLWLIDDAHIHKMRNLLYGKRS